MTKEGISLSIQIATGAGVTGTLAVTATAAVTASLTAVAAAPLAITLAATATRISFSAKKTAKLWFGCRPYWYTIVGTPSLNPPVHEDYIYNRLNRQKDVEKCLNPRLIGIIRFLSDLASGRSKHTL